MDDIDRAQQREQRDREAALNRVRHRELIPPRIIDGEVCCRDCEEPIEAARLRANPAACRCMRCQRIEEQLRGIYGNRN